MPIYEYEPNEDRECLMCPNRVAAIQGINDEPLAYCPDCGLPVHRVLSSATFKISGAHKLDKAAERGFTTWKKAGKGTWERVSGPPTEPPGPSSEER